MHLGRHFLNLARATFDPSSRAGYRDLADYLRAPASLSYVGWVGHSNLGDEWILAGIEKLLSPWRLLAMEYGVPPQLRLSSWLRRGRRHPFLGRLLGGGTALPRTMFLNQACREDIEDLPLYVFGPAFLDAEFWGNRLPELFSEANLSRCADVLRGARFIGVRDEASRSALAAIGISGAQVIGDPAMAIADERRLARDPRTQGRPLRIGLNLGCHDPMWGSREALSEAVAQFVREGRKLGWQFTFIAFSPLDAEAGARLRSLLGTEGSIASVGFHGMEHALQSLLRQEIVIAQRLHAAILPVAFGMPTISIAYNPKCVRFMESIGGERFCIRTDDISWQSLMQATEAILADYVGCADLMWDAAQRTRASLREAAKEVLSDLEAVAGQ